MHENKQDKESVDFFDLLINMWNGKYLIMIFPTLCLVITFLYEISNSKIYLSQLKINENDGLQYVLPVGIYTDLSSMNLTSEGIKKYFMLALNDPETIYEILDENESLLKIFDDKQIIEIFNSINTSNDSIKISIRDLGFNVSDALLINLVNKAYIKTNSYVIDLIKVNLDKRVSNLELVKNMHFENINNEKERLELSLKKLQIQQSLIKQERIKYLENHYEIAKSLGFEEPQIEFIYNEGKNIKINNDLGINEISLSASLNEANNTDNESSIIGVKYFYGSKIIKEEILSLNSNNNKIINPTIESELAVISQRKTNAYIDSYLDLEFLINQKKQTLNYITDNINEYKLVLYNEKFIQNSISSMNIFYASIIAIFSGLAFGIMVNFLKDEISFRKNKQKKLI